MHAHEVLQNFLKKGQRIVSNAASPSTGDALEAAASSCSAEAPAGFNAEPGNFFLNNDCTGFINYCNYILFDCLKDLL